MGGEDRALKAVREQRAVGQIGQRVVECAVLQLALDSTPLAHVLDDDDCVQRPALIIPHDRRVDLNPDHATFVGHQPLLVATALRLTRENAPDVISRLRSVVGVNEIDEGPAEHMVAGRADQPAERFIDVFDSQLLADDRDAHRAFFKHPAKSLFALSQRRFGFLSLFAVGLDSDCPCHRGAQPCQAILEQVVCGALLHCSHRDVLANGS